ncbi:hypothetical protein Tdes44962_MAKER04657 [Teratosphaeria destructans]|uniref:Uncharacterized protein n=1 Tax=Teratosphaeria destructans TaxID=418781 RepID=A0A9W7SMD0_9PEZI|nr:hypothetical protein Tdes44962_MAKER04657 [Teratosphaeria destructans]
MAEDVGVKGNATPKHFWAFLVPSRGGKKEQEGGMVVARADLASDASHRANTHCGTYLWCVSAVLTNADDERGRP